MDSFGMYYCNTYYGSLCISKGVGGWYVSLSGDLVDGPFESFQQAFDHITSRQCPWLKHIDEGNLHFPERLDNWFLLNSMSII